MKLKSQTIIEEKLDNIHPGEILLKEFLEPMGVTAYRLSKDTNIPQTRVSEIIRGKRGISADTALRFARYFGTTVTFWLNLQNSYDVENIKIEKENEINSIVPYNEGNKK